MTTPACNHIEPVEQDYNGARPTINVIFSSFPKIYSQSCPAGGTRHISQSDLPQKSSRQLSLDGSARKNWEAEINTARVDPATYPALLLCTNTVV